MQRFFKTFRMYVWNQFFFSINEKTIHQNLQNICLKSVLHQLVKKQSPWIKSSISKFTHKSIFRWKYKHLTWLFFLVGICIDGCKDKYKEDHCIKSKDGKRITVQSKCHYQCYEEYQGYSFEHYGKCKDSSKPSECMFEISFISVNGKTINQNL